MRNYLNILLIIITLFVMSCSKNTVDSYQSDNEIDFNGSMGNKYKHLYNSYGVTTLNNSHFKFNKIPYSCKLLFQELITMNIAPRIIS